MPHTKSGKYSMNPGYAERMEKGEELEKSRSKWELESIDIRLAKNGYAARCSYKKRAEGREGKGESPACPFDSEEHVFTEMGELVSFVRDRLS